MKFFKVPKTAYTNHYDRARFKLLWNMAAVFVVLMTVVSVSNLNNPNYTSLPNFIAVAIGGFALLILYITRKYERISFITTTSNFITITLTFFFVDALHYTTPMWMMINILFGYFMLGKRWGTLFLVLHFISVLGYVWFNLSNNLANLPVYTNQDMINFITEFTICGFGIGYIIYQFVTTTSDAESRFLRTNSELVSRNKIIFSQKQEKEVMLKEIHHRVKNNLQVISSLLRLQSYELEDNRSIKEFSESINRVKAMALIHEKMYHSSELANINFREYIDSLANDLISSYSVRIPIEVEVESTLQKVGSKTLIPLALLFNELISNSIKHGFQNIEKGIIKIIVSPDNDRYFTVEYSDNGSWKDPSQSNSFGTELIHLMTDQLEGQMNRESSESGTTFSFRLKDIEEDGHFQNN